MGESVSTGEPKLMIVILYKKELLGFELFIAVNAYTGQLLFKTKRYQNRKQRYTVAVKIKITRI